MVDLGFLASGIHGTSPALWWCGLWCGGTKWSGFIWPFRHAVRLLEIPKALKRRGSALVGVL